jgi:hypothetical protein
MISGFVSANERSDVSCLLICVRFEVYNWACLSVLRIVSIA